MSEVHYPLHVRVHLTNVTGAGASRLLESLLPAIEMDPLFSVERIELPQCGPLASYKSSSSKTVTSIYFRNLPNVISRILECTVLARRFDGDSPLLVMGDLPLRCRSPQTLFVQTANLLKPVFQRYDMESLKFWIARQVFRMNCSRVSSFIVQTKVMRDALEKSYPSIAGRVYVVGQPVPTWLLTTKLKRKGRVGRATRGLNLFYPASGYSHKNHFLLSRLDPLVSWPVNRLALTIDEFTDLAPRLPWVDCLGFLSPEEMISEYSQADALLFLSKKESYGFPLIEAMFVGIPIVCPDLAYAREICGDQAIYFDPDDPSSLLSALKALEVLLLAGWWPSWERPLSRIPKSWNDIARQMLTIACIHVMPLPVVDRSTAN